MPGTPRKVSTIVPTRDRPAYLRQALASVRALEGPDLSFEILVADNGCAAETRPIVEEFAATYLKAPKLGAAAARNVGLRAATGDYISFLDDDDVWLPDNVRPHIALLDAHPELDAVIGQAVSTDPHLCPEGPPWPEDPPGEGDQLLRNMLSGFFPQIGTTVARSNAAKAIGEFDEALIGGEDLDWLLRIARQHRLGFVPTACILFRGRPCGTYDSLQWLRVGFDRRVFFRHAIPEWRIWGSPRAFSRAYRDTLAHFYYYFVDAAAARAETGDLRGAVRAVVHAIGVAPIRAMYHIVARRKLGKALLKITKGACGLT